MDEFLALKLKQAFALVMSCGGVVMIAMGVGTVWFTIHPPRPITLGTEFGACGFAVLLCAVGVGLECVAVWLRGKAVTLLNAAVNAVITAAAIGGGLLSARMSSTPLSPGLKFLLVLLTVGAAVAGALFFFRESRKSD